MVFMKLKCYLVCSTWFSIKIMFDVHGYYADFESFFKKSCVNVVNIIYTYHCVEFLPLFCIIELYPISVPVRSD